MTDLKRAMKLHLEWMNQWMEMAQITDDQDGLAAMACARRSFCDKFGLPDPDMEGTDD